MGKSLRTRLWLTYAVLIANVMCLFSISLGVYLLRNPAALRLEIARLEITANLLQRLEKSLEANALVDYQQLAERADKNLNARIVILSQVGETLADSRQSSEPPVPALSLPPLSSARFTLVRQFRDSNNQVWLYTLRLHDNGKVFMVCLPRPRLTLGQLFRDEAWTPFYRSGLLALLLSLVFAWYISRWIVKPLERMSAAAQSVAAGKYEPIPLEGPAEVQALAQSFNEMSRQVQASQKSQRDFVANVSHDLKTPLTSIQGFAQAILDGAANTPEMLQQAARVIYDEAMRMARMVQDLLDLARLDSGIADMRRETIYLAPLLEGLITQFTPQAQTAQITLDVHILPLPPVIGDPDRLSQAVANLLDNAIKFSSTGGKVYLSAISKGKEVEIAIIDEGPGIPPEDIPRIFDRFYQTEKSRTKSRRGTGLGLAIAREIVTAHGGRIDAYNNSSGQLPQVEARNAERRTGSTFLITLPVSAAGGAATNAVKNPPAKGVK